MVKSGLMVITPSEIQFLKELAIDVGTEPWGALCEKGNHLFTKCPPLKYVFQEASENGHNIQPGYIVETVLATSLAYANYITNFNYNADEKNRFVYYNDNNTLIQKGGCTDTDLYFNDIPIEIKDLKSVAGEIDLYCMNDGKIDTTKYSKNTQQRFELMLPLIQDFNSRHTIWEMEGHNFPLAINGANASLILKAYFNQNNIKFLLTYNKQGYFYLIDVNSAADMMDFSGSEIRTCGKNHVKLYSIEHFLERLYEEGGVYDEASGIIAIRKENAIPRGERGGRGITGYKIGTLFYMPIKEVKEYKNMYYTYISKIQQQKQSMSLHIKLKEEK